MILRLLARLIQGGESDQIAHWSDERARYYERATYRYTGLLREPIYTWSHKFRPRKLKMAAQIAERKRA